MFGDIMTACILFWLMPATFQHKPFQVDGVVIAANSTEGVCPSDATIQSARRNLKASIKEVFEPLPCGGLNWRTVININPGDPSQQCPSPWIESFGPARSCRTPPSNICWGPRFSVSGVPYSRVCGRVIGSGENLLGGFTDIPRYYNNINSVLPYVDGVSVTTHTSPRQHIWTFGASRPQGSRCPCDNSNAPAPSPFVGNNYFCDTELNGAFWDGKNCTTPCCTYNDPPWFNVALSTPTSDDIEVRICTDQHGETIHVQLVQIFVQ